MKERGEEGIGGERLARGHINVQGQTKQTDSQIEPTSLSLSCTSPAHPIPEKNSLNFSLTSPSNLFRGSSHLWPSTRGGGQRSRSYEMTQLKTKV